MGGWEGESERQRQTKKRRDKDTETETERDRDRDGERQTKEGRQCDGAADSTHTITPVPHSHSVMKRKQTAKDGYRCIEIVLPPKDLPLGVFFGGDQPYLTPPRP